MALDYVVKQGKILWALGLNFSCDGGIAVPISSRHTRSTSLNSANESTYTVHSGSTKH